MSVLFGCYLLVASLFAPVVGLPVVLAGSVLFVGVQYVTYPGVNAGACIAGGRE